MSKYCIFDSDGIMYTTFPDDPSQETVLRDFVHELSAAVNRTSSVRQLIDITSVHSLPDETAVRILVEGIKNLRKPVPEDKVAIFGLNTFTSIATRLVLTLTKRHDIRIFKTREEGLRWLKE